MMAQPYELSGERIAEGSRPPTTDEKTMVEFAIMKMVDIVNGLPGDARGTVIVSLVTTICMNSEDPRGLCMAICEHVVQSVADFTKPAAG